MNIKAIFINAIDSKVELITIKNFHSFLEIYPIMGLKCDMLECISYFGSNTLLIDEEGRYNGHGFVASVDESRYVGFRIDVSEIGDNSEYFDVIGNGIIMGVNDEGITVDVDIDTDIIAPRVKFLSSKQVKELKEI